MFDTQKPHPYLAQVPLTVSPFLSIPTAVTLPYTFRSVPSSLPASILTDAQNGEKAKFVKSASGHAANPEDIINSCRVLQQHISKASEDAKSQTVRWQDEINQRELAEKRRVAPGWLDRDEKILEPTKIGANPSNLDLLEGHTTDVTGPVMSPNREGEELDRVFGKLSTK